MEKTGGKNKMLKKDTPNKAKKGLYIAKVNFSHNKWGSFVQGARYLLSSEQIKELKKYFKEA